MFQGSNWSPQPQNLTGVDGRDRYFGAGPLQNMLTLSNRRSQSDWDINNIPFHSFILTGALFFLADLTFERLNATLVSILLL